MQPPRCLLFDWGNTLMRDFSAFEGPMKDWPTVEAMPGARETLACLQVDWILALATNADDSSEENIWAALRRVALDQVLDKVYGYKTIGHKKPSAEFFQYILKDLRLTTDQVVMVGDSFDNDVLGANRSGLRAIWYNWQTSEIRENGWHWTIHELGELPGIMKKLT